MLESIKKFERMSIATSVLLIIFAIFLIARPEASINFMVIVIGVFLALIGIYHGVSYFTSDKEVKTISTELIQATLYSVIGIFLIFKPEILNQFLGVIVGAWSIIQFIIKFQFAFNLKSATSPAWSIMLISALIHLVIGIFVLINPLAALIAVTTFVGIVLLVSEVGNIAESILVLTKK